MTMRTATASRHVRQRIGPRAAGRARRRLRGRACRGGGSAFTAGHAAWPSADGAGGVVFFGVINVRVAWPLLQLLPQPTLLLFVVVVQPPSNLAGGAMRGACVVCKNTTEGKLRHTSQHHR